MTWTSKAVGSFVSATGSYTLAVSFKNAKALHTGVCLCQRGLKRSPHHLLPVLASMHTLLEEHPMNSIVSCTLRVIEMEVLAACRQPQLENGAAGRHWDWK